MSGLIGWHIAQLVLAGIATLVALGTTTLLSRRVSQE